MSNPPHYRGDQHYAWRGGRRVQANGYVIRYAPDHPKAHAGCVYEHVLVVEAALGHLLPPKAVVHHHDEQKANNAPGNLVACEDESYHRLLHKRMRAFAETGDANAVRCSYCHTYDVPPQIAVFANGRGHHRDCLNRYQRAQRATRAS